MCFLNDSCCICTSKSNLKHMFDVDCHGISHYDKLTSSIVEMNFEEMTDQRLICGECCVTLNTVYSFRQMCLRSKMNLLTNMSQVKEEIEIKCENESSICFEEHIPQMESYNENIPTTVNEYEVPTFTFVNVGVENVDNATMMEDEHRTESSEIDIQQHVLVQFKEEPVSDTETSAHGSTNQADARTSEESKESNPIATELLVRLTQNTSTQSKRKKHLCEICNKNYLNKESLRSHMRIHADVKPNECEFCDERFLYRYTLLQHMQIHSDEKPFECEECGERFNLRKSYSEHMRTHDKPYKCKICFKAFKTNCERNRHVRTHSTYKPFKCELCEKSFIDKDYLKKHLRVHLKDKKSILAKLFNCETCGKGFNKRHDLLIHMRIHSGERPFECEICQKRFVLKHHLKSHMEKLHS